MIGARVRRAFTAVRALPLTLAVLVMSGAAALAGAGQPSPWQRGLQDAATPVSREIHWFHDYVNAIIIAITGFVLLLMLWVMVRYREGANPTPSKTTHNTFIEVVWTVLPVLILVAIALPSFRLLYFQYSFPKADLTIKATASAWAWSHEYPDHGNAKVDSVMVRDEDVIKTKIGEAEFTKRYAGLGTIERNKRLYADAQPIWIERKQPRQLAVDNEIVVPVNKNVHVLVTSSDVIHNWTVPSFGSKVDAVPGRITATWFRAEQTGVFYGQCSELCGKDHANMPIAVRVVAEGVFNEWIAAVRARDRRKAREVIERASVEDGGLRVAGESSPRLSVAASQP